MLPKQIDINMPFQIIASQYYLAYENKFGDDNNVHKDSPDSNS